MLPLIISLTAFEGEQIAYVVPRLAPDVSAFHENMSPEDGSEYVLPDLLFHQAESPAKKTLAALLVTDQRF